MEYYTYIYIARNCRKVAEQRLDNGEKIDLVEGTLEEFVAAMLNPKSAAGAMAKNRFVGLKKVSIHIFSCLLAYAIRYVM